MRVLDYNSIKWGDYFYISEDSPSGLRWKVDIHCGKGNKTVRLCTDKVAGYIVRAKNGAVKGWLVGLKGNRYCIHRIIYVLLNGEISSQLVIDHKDGNPLNNNACNIILTTVKQNSRNRKMSSNNNSGAVGVSMESSLNKDGSSREYWRVFWRGLNGIPRSKLFSVKRFGKTYAFELAVAYRAEQMELLNAAGAGYTERHISKRQGEQE